MQNTQAGEHTQEEPMRRKNLMIVSTITYVENAPQNYEHPKGASLTVPDMAMSIQVIMDKYVTGNPIDQQETVYFDDEFPDIRMMSKTDLLEAQMQVESELEKIREAVKQHNEMEAFEAEKSKKRDDQGKIIEKIAEKLVDKLDEVETKKQKQNAS